MIVFNYKKAVQLLSFFSIESGGSINKMKAIKLVWLSDRLHLRKYGRTITGDIYFALPFGPVASTTRDLVESNELLSDDEIEYVGKFLGNFSRYHYECIHKPDFKALSLTDKHCAEDVFRSYGHLDHFQLSELSHHFPEWKKYESALEMKIASRFNIDLNDFFLNINDLKVLFVDND